MSNAMLSKIIERSLATVIISCFMVEISTMTTEACVTQCSFLVPYMSIHPWLQEKIGRLGGFRKAFQGLRWILVNDFRNTVISIEQKMSVI
jgi:hypothetical protein